MMIKLKDSRESISAPPFCKHAGLRLLPNAPDIPNCGLVLKLAGYHVSRALEASLGFVHYSARKFVIYSLIQYSNQVLYCCYKDQYDFNTKTSIYSVNKCTCCRNYIFAELQPFRLLLQYHIPRIIMYASNDVQQRVFIYCAFPVFLMFNIFFLEIKEESSIWYNIDRCRFQSSVSTILPLWSDKN